MPLATARPRDLRALAPAPLANTRGSTPRINVKDVIRDRTKTHLPRFDRGVQNTFAGGATFPRQLDNKNGVFGRERDEENKADLHVEIVGHAKSGQRTYCSKQRQRDGKNHRGRSYPTFVLSSEHEIDQKKGKREDEPGSVACQFLLIRHCGPFITHPGRQRFCRDALPSLANAWPELKASLALPLMVAEGKRL